MTRIRVFSAALGAEVNTFSASPMNHANFRDLCYFPSGRLPADAPPPLIAAPLRRARELARLGEIELIEGICAGAQPGGIISRQTYEALRDELLADLVRAGPVDLVLLGLHGATVAAGYADCEGDILRRVRAQIGERPTLAALLDPHAHLSRAMIEPTDLLYAYKEYPHDDIFETADRLVDDALRTVRGEIRPVIRAFDCRMLGVYNTYHQPMRGYVDDLLAEIGPSGPLLDISVAHGFPWGDVEDAGTRVWVTSDGDGDRAARAAERWGQRLVAIRQSVQPQLLSPEAAISRVREHDRVVVLAETADNPGGGAPSDATHLIRAAAAAGLGPVAAGLIWDPIALQICEAAGEGADLYLRIGGKASPLSGSPLDLHVNVVRMTANLEQPFGGGTWSAGRAVRLAAGDLTLILTEHRTQCFAAEAFTTLGVDLAAQRAIIVKSSNHFEASFRKLTDAIYRVETPGALAHDFSSLPYRNIQRPIAPLDREGAIPRLLDWRSRP